MNHRLEADLLREVISHLKAGRWSEAHDLVQQVDSNAAAWLHGIVQIQEGDLEDAEYWYDRAGRDFRQRGSLELTNSPLTTAARGLSRCVDEGLLATNPAELRLSTNIV